MSIQDSSSLGTTSNKVTFNDFNASPLFRATKRAPSRREVREFDIPLPEAMGVADFQTLIGKSYFILEGNLYPDDELGFNLGRRSLRKLASLEVAQADGASDQGYVPYVWNEYDGDKQLMVKVLYADMEESTRRGLKQPFRLLCKIKDPVIRNTQTKTVTLSTGTTATAGLGGMEIPALVSEALIGAVPSGTTVVPIILPVVIGATATSGSNTISNTGDLPAYPTITIYGPISRPRITYGRTGEYIELDVTLATVNDSAIISYDKDDLSITANNQNSYGKLTSGSTLFKIQPGDAAFTLTGAAGTAGSSATIAFYPTFPLS